jgi:hypothetical protein
MKDKIVTMKSVVEQRRGYDKLRAILCIVLAFLLAFAIVVLSVLSIIEWSCFNKNSLYRDLLTSYYYDNVQSEFYTKAEAITIPTGLPTKVLDDIAEENQVQQDINAFIDKSFQKVAYLVDTTPLKGRLERNINGFLDDEGIAPNREQLENINRLIESVSTEYKKAIEMPLLAYLLRAREYYEKIFQLGIAGCSVIIVTLFLMLLKLNYKLCQALRYLSYSVSAAAMMLIIAPAFILISKVYKRILLYPQYYYQFVMTFIQSLLNLMLNTGFFLITISVAIIIFRSYRVNRIEKKHEVG